MIFFVFYFFLKKHAKYNKKIARYIKVYVKHNAIFLFCISAIISNTYLIYLNKDYESIYKNDEKDISGIAIVISPKDEKEYVNSYVIKIRDGDYKNKRFILNVKKNVEELEYGDLIEFSGKYITPDKARNYRGFDYSKYLKTKEIYGTINKTSIKILNKKELMPLLIYSNSIRNSIIEKANSILPQKEASLLIGILLGEKNDISEETIEAFQKSSLSHILAVSGMHVSYIILRSKLHFI